VVGNEVLDAMPVRLLVRGDRGWLERGVVLGAGGALAWADRPTDASPPLDPAADADAFAPGSVTEIHPQAEAFVRTIAAALTGGAAFFVDYGFPAAEYHHPQRRGGTLMCHRAHRADPDPLADPGAKDITAHVDFSAIALAGQDAGLSVLGYTSQARFLLNCGITPMLADAPLAMRVDGQRLLHEHEMGELFKVIGFVAGPPFDAVGFAAGDRTHRL
jgi:SAM-dependent MidA family methyltransferase